MNLEQLLTQFQSHPQASEFLRTMAQTEKSLQGSSPGCTLDDPTMSTITSSIYGRPPHYATETRAVKDIQSQKLVSGVLLKYIGLREVWHQAPDSKILSGSLMAVTNNIIEISKHLSYDGLEQWKNIGFGSSPLPTDLSEDQSEINPLTYFVTDIRNKESLGYKVLNYFYAQEFRNKQQRNKPGGISIREIPGGTNPLRDTQADIGAMQQRGTQPPPLPRSPTPSSGVNRPASHPAVNIDQNEEIPGDSIMVPKDYLETLLTRVNGIQELLERERVSTDESLESIKALHRLYGDLRENLQIGSQARLDDLANNLDKLYRTSFENLSGKIKGIERMIEAVRVSPSGTAGQQNLGDTVARGEASGGPLPSTPTPMPSSPIPSSAPSPAASATAESRVPSSYSPKSTTPSRGWKYGLGALAVAGILGAGVLGAGALYEHYYHTEKYGALVEEHDILQRKMVTQGTELMKEVEKASTIAGQLNSARKVCGTQIQENIGKPQELVDLIENCYLARQPNERVILEGKDCNALYTGLHYALGGTSKTEEGFRKTLEKARFCDKPTIRRQINYPSGSIPIIVVTKDNELKNGGSKQ